MGAPIALVAAGIWLGAIWFLVVPSLRRPTRRHVAAFADLYAVPVTSATEPLIVDALWWSRRWRVAGGLTGALGWWAHSGDSMPFNLMAIAAGVAAGSLVAELTRRSPTPTTVRVASTDIRHVTDHVQRFAVVGFAILWGLSLLVVTAAALAVTTPERVAGGDLVIGFGSLAVSGAALALGRTIARRPAPRSDPAVAAVQHAVRTASISAVLGGGMIIVAAGTSQLAFAMVLADSSMPAPVRHLNNAAMWLSLVATFGGLGLVLGSFPRRYATRSAAVPA